VIYTVRNTHRANVFDVATKQKINFVVEADTDAATLKVMRQPIEFTDDQPVCDTVQFRSIHPVFGDCPVPQMLLCFS
jgi:hypothetical protein